MALKVTEGAAFGAAIHAAWTYCHVKGKPLSLEKLVDDLVAVDKKTRVEPRKETQTIYQRTASKTDRPNEKAEGRRLSLAARSGSRSRV